MAYEYKSPLPGYTAGGYTNLGPTPGILPQPKQTQQTSTQQPNTWHNTLSDVMSSKPATGAVKKIVDANGNQIHFDTFGSSKVTDKPKSGTNKGILPADSAINQSSNSQQTNSSNSPIIQNTNGTYTTGEGSNNVPITTTPNTPIESPAPTPPPVPTVGSTATGLVGTTQKTQDIADRYGQKISGIGEIGAGQAFGERLTGITPVGEGQARLTEAATAAKQTAATQGMQASLAGIGYQQTGLNQAGQLVSPINQTATGLLTNPTNGESISGNLGDTVTLGTNIKSIQDGQSKINNIDQISGGAKNNLQLAISLANQIPNLNKDAPAVNAIKQAIASNLTTSESLPAFQVQVAAVKQAYDSLGIPAEGIADWNNITVNQLTNLAANLDKTISNQKAGIQSNIDSLKSGLSGGTTNKSTSGGSLFSW